MRTIQQSAGTLIAGFLSVFILPLASFAEEPLSRDEAVRQALLHNPRLSVAEQQQIGANARLNASRGGLLPSVDVSYQARKSDNPLDAFADRLNTRQVDPATDFSADALNDPDPSTLYMTRLSLVWPLFTGGENWSRVRAARARADSAGHGHEHARAQIAHGTLSAYMQTQAAGQSVALLEDAVAAAQRHVNTTSRLVREGRIIASDKLTAEVFLSSMQNAREQARERLRRARAGLAQILGRESLESARLDSWNSDRIIVEINSIDKRWQNALAARKDLAALQSQRDAARAEADASRAAYSPKFNVVANRDWYQDDEGADADSWSVAGVVSLNLFAGGRTHHGLRASKAQAVAKEAELRDKQLAIRRELAEAHARYNSAAERLRISEGHVDKARRSVSQITQRYGQGRTILIDVLQAERALVETRSQSLAAGLDLELANIDLQLADGSLMQAWAAREVK